MHMTHIYTHTYTWYTLTFIHTHIGKHQEAQTTCGVVFAGATLCPRRRGITCPFVAVVRRHPGHCWARATCGGSRPATSTYSAFEASNVISSPIVSRVQRRGAVGFRTVFFARSLACACEDTATSQVRNCQQILHGGASGQSTASQTVRLFFIFYIFLFKQ